MIVKTVIAVLLVIVLSLLAVFYLDRADNGAPGHSRAVQRLIERNVAARGGAAAWQAVSALRQSGRMDVGQEMTLPYVLEQKRPGKMCLEFVFDEQTSTQCVDGQTGWKVVPFQGRTTPEPMTAAERREMADTADPYGLLFDSAARGHRVELLGQEPVEGRNAYKLKVSLPGGAVRWLYLDAETGLEIKLEALRMLAGRERRVETFFRDWQPAEGLLIARRQDTRTEGDKASHFLTVESVEINPPLDDARFAMPASRKVDPGFASTAAHP